MSADESDNDFGSDNESESFKIYADNDEDTVIGDNDCDNNCDNNNANNINADVDMIDDDELIDDDDIKEDEEESKTNKINKSGNKIIKVRNRQRGISFDSQFSDSTKKPNYKCESCKNTFLLERHQKMIRCLHCGCRVIFKLRTTNYITYKAE